MRVRKSTIFLLLIFHLTISGQTFGDVYTYGYQQEKRVVKDIDKQIRKGEAKKISLLQLSLRLVIL